MDKIGPFTSPSINYFSPARILMGVGASKMIGKEAKALWRRKAVIVTDPGVTRTGMVEAVRESLLSEKVEAVVYGKAELETPAEVIDDAARFTKEEKCDLVIGLGGGTSLDTAKGVSVMATNSGTVLEYQGMDRVPNRGLTKILVPTTAGSGSEVTRVFAVTDKADHTKKVVYTSFNLADMVILDPLLTVSLPPTVTAETGMDALAHAIESYVSVNATPFSDMFAMEAMRLVRRSLLTAFCKGEKIDARFDMLLAACLAGLAFSSGGLGAVHALSFVLESDHGIGHGRAVAVMLPHVMEFNKIGAMDRYRAIAELLGETGSPLPDNDAAERAVTAVRRLLDETNISYRLSDYGISEKDLPKMVKSTMRQSRLFAPNPRHLTSEDVHRLYAGSL